MLLTIGMIVKNEEKYLKRCLDAIQPLLEQVESELVIADTGSEDSTVEIARSYTDQVHRFAWCDDFSAARNFVLEKAQGEWFFSLDADEIFQDVTELIEFFNSGRHKDFRSAAIVLRNDNAAKDRSRYSDSDALKLGRIETDTRFINKIHETRPYHMPTAKLSSVAVHYGCFLTGKDGLNGSDHREASLHLLELYLMRKDLFAAEHIAGLIPLSGWPEHLGNRQKRLALEILLNLESNPDIPYLSVLANPYELDQLLQSGVYDKCGEMPALVLTVLEKNSATTSSASILWLSVLTMWTLLNGGPDRRQTVQLFLGYTEMTERFLTASYREDFLKEENSGLFPPQLRAGYYCCLALNALKNQESSKYLDYLKVVIRLQPDLKHVVEILLEDLPSSLHSTPSKKEILSEFDQYAAVVKTNIRKLIENGKPDQALELLDAFEQLCPTDPEVEALKTQLTPGPLH